MSRWSKVKMQEMDFKCAPWHDRLGTDSAAGIGAAFCDGRVGRRVGFFKWGVETRLELGGVEALRRRRWRREIN